MKLANAIYNADCISVLPRSDGLEKIPKESIDLVYLDPPFFSGQNYDIVWGNGAELEAYTRRPSGVGSEEVFADDTMYWSEQTPDSLGIAKFIDDLIAQGLIDKKDREQAILKRASALRGRVGKGAVHGYLAYMAPRLRAIHRALKDTGSIYLHCDWHSNAHLRLLMDEIFGENRFLNEIVWFYRDPAGTVKDRWKKKHDMILFYAKGNEHTFNMDDVREPYAEGTLEQNRRGTVSFGRPTKTHPLGKVPVDVWAIPFINSMAKERLGYPTQKPEALLERIVLASSNKGDIVLDPFAGGGTTLAVAHRLGRRWIGIDVSARACDVMRGRLVKLGAEVPKRINVPYDPSIEAKVEMTMTMLREQDWEATEEWVRQQLGFAKSPTSVRYGVDGIKKKTLLEVKDWSGPVGRPVVEKLAGAMVRIGSTSGVIASYEFSSGAIQAIQEFEKKGLHIEMVYFNDLAEKTLQTKLEEERD